MFRLSLKDEYQPDTESLDFIVEDVLQRSFVTGSLEKQESKLDIDYPTLLKEWQDIDIEKVITDYINKYMK